MCSFTNHGHMYLAGGTADNAHNRRLYRIESNEIVQLDDIPFDFGLVSKFTSLLVITNQKRLVCWQPRTTWYSFVLRR